MSEQPVEDSSDCLDDAPPNEQLVDCCDEEIYASSANNTSRKSVSGGGIPASGGVAVDDGVAPDDARAQSKVTKQPVCRLDNSVVWSLHVNYRLKCRAFCSVWWMLCIFTISSGELVSFYNKAGV